MKVIFLDIDGVLNHDGWYHRIWSKGAENVPDYPMRDFDPECVERVNLIVASTDDDCGVVLTSSWRIDDNIDEICAKVGLPELYGKTPSLPNRHRDKEIRKWLGEHPEVDDYVIFDDDMISGDWGGHFIKVNPNVGLTDSNLMKAIKLLR